MLSAKSILDWLEQGYLSLPTAPLQMPEIENQLRRLIAANYPDIGKYEATIEFIKFEIECTGDALREWYVPATMDTEKTAEAFNALCNGFDDLVSLLGFVLLLGPRQLQSDD